MKKILFYMVFCLASSFYTQAQTPEFATGKVKYIFVSKLNNAPDSNVATLLFSPQYSAYSFGQTAHDDIQLVENGMNYKIEGDKNGHIYYRDIKQKKLVARELIFNKYFIIEDKTGAVKWDIKTEQKMIGSLMCTKAVGEHRGRVYTAWFTTDVPVNVGPWKLDGLPGLILEAYDQEKQIQFLFHSLEMPLKERWAIKEPTPQTSEQRLTWEEYSKRMKNKIDALTKTLAASSKDGSSTTIVKFNLLEQIGSEK
jgi:GLPGLI family protein